MGSSAADTHGEINRLRGDMTAALEEIERRLRGGLKSVASSEARVKTSRAQHQVASKVRHNPTLLGVAGVVVAGAVGYGIFSAITVRRRKQKVPQSLTRNVKHAGAELAQRVAGGVELSRRQLLERVGQRNLLLKLDPQDGGYLRVAEARIEPLADKNKERSDVIKRLVWAGVLSVFMALGSVVARRVAGGVWRATVREDPPGQSKSA
jgi:hypothetical protein